MKKKAFIILTFSLLLLFSLAQAEKAPSIPVPPKSYEFKGALNIRIHPPENKLYPSGELLIIDLLGRKVGTDPRVNKTYTEIPDSSYESESIADAETGAPGPETRIIDIRNPTDGEYILYIIGTEASKYDMEIRGYDCDMKHSHMDFLDIEISEGDEQKYIMTLRGKRIVWGSETNEGRRFDIGKVKWLVGGDTLIGRPPHGSREIQFNPTHTLLLLTNHKPKAEADDYAFWQRVLLIPFNLSFVDDPKKDNERKRDPYLKEKLLAESSGILAWLVKGCLMWQREGLNPTKEIKDATASYKEEEDILGHYIKERCKILSDGIVRASEFYADYKRWCEDNGHRPLSNTKFGKKMSERYPKDKDGKGNFYSGVSLIYTSQSDEENKQ